MTIQCPICRRLHNGDSQICDDCGRDSYAQQDADHHTDCPKAWHPGAQCRCSSIRGSRWE
jgi:hypothetical protein